MNCCCEPRGAAGPIVEQLERLGEIGAQFPDAGEAAIPLPMPLFCELDQEAFVETVRTRVAVSGPFSATSRIAGSSSAVMCRYQTSR